MATYAIGDVQGCYKDLRALLTKLQFNPSSDQLWLVGDLVNRGPGSLDTLRYVCDLGSAATVVLGNHDLHLLAASVGARSLGGSDTIGEILDAADAPELLHWLRQQPLMHHDDELNISMVHAGLLPSWTLGQAIAHAAEVEDVLRGDKYQSFFKHMYGDKPAAWGDDLEGNDRLRVIVNAMTRMRFVASNGEMQLRHKGSPNDTNGSVMPWFLHPERQTQQDRIVVGHWSALGLMDEHNVVALDSGCVWGGALTAARLDTPQVEMIGVACLPKQSIS